MDHWIVFFLVALLASLSATEFVRIVAFRLSAVDVPGGRRVHRRPTPRLGGLGIFWGFAAAWLVGVLLHPARAGLAAGADGGLVALLVGGGVLLVTGLFDDVRGLPAVRKLVVQIGAALLLHAGGWRVESLGWPGLGVWETGSLSLPLTIGWVVFVTNAINLIDGLDGLACGVALVAAASAAVLLAPAGGPAMLAAVALAGALLGFLWFNLNPALIFMGDAGSLFVGFVLSGVTLRAGQLASAEAFPLVPVLLLAVPLFDTSYAIVRRGLGAARATRSAIGFLRDARAYLFAPDRGHVHHLLLQSGLAPRRAVLLLWGAAGSFALSGCMLAHLRLPGLVVLAVAAAVWFDAYRALRRRLAALADARAAAPAEPAGAVVHAGADADAAPAPTRAAA